MLNVLDLPDDPIAQAVRECRHSILVPFSTAYDELSPLKVCVHDAQRAALRDTEARTIEQLDHQPVHAPRWHGVENTPDLIAG